MAAFIIQRINHPSHNHIKHTRTKTRVFAITTSLSATDPTDLQLQTLDGITPITEFEPVINVPATFAFLLIAVTFAILQFRINAVSTAARRRSNALEALRRAESLQLSCDDSMERPDETSVAAAKVEYENALRAELDLRTVIPGVRIVAPNDPKRDEEQRAAAKRFLGWDGKEFGDDLDLKADEKLEQGGGEQNKLSGGAQVILFGVASILILLLWTLSFDPMSPSGSITAF